MNISPKYYLLVLVLFCTVNLSLGQRTYQVGILPAINLNKKVAEKWSVNFKVESRQSLRTGSFSGESMRQYNYLLSDFTLIGSRKFALNSRLAGGFLLRFRDGQEVLRSIQQYATVRRFNSFRLAHRFVCDQTFVPNEHMEVRIRYRLGAEIPLNGAAVDVNEFYIKINNEYLVKWQNLENDVEFRVVPMIGYVPTSYSKIELGLDYRHDSFLDSNSKQSFWTSLNCYLSF